MLGLHTRIKDRHACIALRGLHAALVHVLLKLCARSAGCSSGRGAHATPCNLANLAVNGILLRHTILPHRLSARASASKLRHSTRNTAVLWGVAFKCCLPRLRALAQPKLANTSNSQ